MVLGKIVGTICLAFAPVDLTLSLANAIAYPIEPHVDCFGPFLFHGVGHNTTCSVIVRRHGSGRLWMAELLKSNADRASFFSIVE
jgi:hypothetical protein